MITNIIGFRQNNNPLPQKSDGKLDFKEITRVFNIGMNFLGGQNEQGQNKLEQVVFGGLPPNVLDIEEAILGSILLDYTAFPKIKGILGKFPKPFYKDAHNAIWRAILSLDKKDNEFDRAIDRLTVWMEMERLGIDKEINGNPYFLVQLTEGISTSAHIESHVRILLQTTIQRKLLNMSLQMVQQMYTKTTDALKVLDAHVKHLSEFQDQIFGDDLLLEKKSGNDLITMMHEARESKRIIGDFLTQGSITLMFAPAKVGKSIASVMLGIDAAAGTGSLGGILENEVGPQKVAYFDFELTPSDWKARYGCKETGTYFDFATNAPTFARYSEKQIFKNYESFASIVIKELKYNVHQDQPDVIILDNLTYLTDGSINPEIATTIMKTLKEFNKMYGTSIIVLCHTPKNKDRPTPITEDNMAGSAQLKNFATDVVGIAKSCLGVGHVYFKHLISRGRQVEFDEKKTIHCKIEKTGPFLGMKFIDFCEESEHLTTWDEKEEEEDMIKEAAKLQGTMSLRDIMKQLKLPFKSPSTLQNKINKYNKSLEQETQKFNEVLKNNTIDPSLSLVKESDDDKVELYALPEFDKHADNKEFESIEDFMEATKLYFQVVTKISNNEHLKLEFHSEPEKDKKGNDDKKDILKLAYVYRGTSVVHVNSFNWQHILVMDENAPIKGEYKHEILKIRQRGIRGQFAMLWLLCHEIMHLVAPELKHGKVFFDRVEMFYNKCLRHIRETPF
ncbi:MAG: hypothetical protein RIS64_3673 [Bacteroidota bacterium]|jgi:hypothetical protein